MPQEPKFLRRKKPTTNGRIKLNSEKAIMKTIQDVQTKIDEINGAMINIRAFFYHYKHANERDVTQK